MTTAIIVNAHAGWDVEVICEQLDSEGKIVSSTTKIVPKYTQETIYIHSNLHISAIREIQSS